MGMAFLLLLFFCWNFKCLRIINDCVYVWVVLKALAEPMMRHSSDRLKKWSELVKKRMPVYTAPEKDQTIQKSTQLSYTIARFYRRVFRFVGSKCPFFFMVSISTNFCIVIQFIVRSIRFLLFLLSFSLTLLPNLNVKKSVNIERERKKQQQHTYNNNGYSCTKVRIEDCE